MKERISWLLVFSVVLITIAVSFGVKSIYTQQNVSPRRNVQIKEDFSKYPIADYDAQKSASPEILNQRERKNRRYDHQHIVSSKPRPETEGATVYDDDSLPSEAIPTRNSDLVVTGRVVSAEAFLSNDKRSVYSEYMVEIEEILKSDDSSLISGSTITMDRFGGFVRYPNGQKVLYRVAGLDLPTVGDHYVLFLKTDGNSPNYKIITGYELNEDSVIPLDSAVDFSHITEKKEKGFKSLIRDKISENKN